MDLYSDPLSYIKKQLRSKKDQKKNDCFTPLDGHGTNTKQNETEQIFAMTLTYVCRLYESLSVR